MSAAPLPHETEGQDVNQPLTRHALLPSPMVDLPEDSSNVPYSFSTPAKQPIRSQSDVSRAEADEVIQLRDSTIEHDTIQQPTGFAPFFTLIEDSWTGEHHHPHVHYIFADDDPDLVTNTILQELEPAAPHEGQGSVSTTTNLTTSLDTASTTNEEVAKANIAHRTLIVDIGSDGVSVQGFKSLTPAWQLSSASIALAPTFNGAGGAVVSDSLDAPGNGETGLMLRLEGVEHNSSAVTPHENSFGKAPTAEELYILSRRIEGGGDALATMCALREKFKRDLEVLSKLLQNSHSEMRNEDTQNEEIGATIGHTESKEEVPVHTHDSDL